MIRYGLSTLILLCVSFLAVAGDDEGQAWKIPGLQPFRSRGEVVDVVQSMESELPTKVTQGESVLFDGVTLSKIKAEYTDRIINENSAGLPVEVERVYRDVEIVKFNAPQESAWANATVRFACSESSSGGQTWTVKSIQREGVEVTLTDAICSELLNEFKEGPSEIKSVVACMAVLPKAPVKVGETWRVESANLVNLLTSEEGETVTVDESASKGTASLKSVDQGIATIDCTTTIVAHGVYEESAEYDVTLVGDFEFQIDMTENRILRMNIKGNMTLHRTEIAENVVIDVSGPISASTTYSYKPTGNER